MRVIAGTYRSRLLAAPPGSLTRPTSDRLRETLFNILAPRIPGSRFVDLYAGTGAVGIEAISRGAAHVWFSENTPAPIAALRANLRALGISAGYTLEDRGTGALLDRLGKLAATASTKAISPNASPSPQPPTSTPSPNAVDMVFLDPPYEAENEYTATLTFLGSQRGLNLLAPDALVVAEHATRTPLPTTFGGLTATRTRKQGDASLTFYNTTPDPNPPLN